MSFTQPASNNISDVNRANVYAISNTAPTAPLPGDLWADTSYSTPPGPQVKQWIGGGWRLYRGASFSAKTFWGWGHALAPIQGNLTQIVHCTTGPMGSISPALGLEIAFSGTMTMSSSAQTNPGPFPMSFGVQLGYHIPLPDGSSALVTDTLTSTGLSVAIYGNNPGQAMTGQFAVSLWLPRRDNTQAVVANDLVGMGRVGAAVLTGSTTVTLIGNLANGGLVDGYLSNGSGEYAGITYDDVAVKLSTPTGLSLPGGFGAQITSLVVSTINEG